MKNSPLASPLPIDIPAAMAWNAFDHLYTQTNFRLQIETLDPISLTVEHDAAFGACLSGVAAWEPTEKARGWIANRVLELAAQINKASVRRLSLQVPRPGDEQAIDAFLTGLQRRLKDDLRVEVSKHFDQSLKRWEDDAMSFAYGCEDPHDRVKFFSYCGLDQLVSIDAGRQGLKWIFGRTHFYLSGTGSALELIPDYLFDNAKVLRGSINEKTRARSLAARCVEVLIDEGVRRAMADEVFAPVTRASIKADLTRIFQKDGVWGLIHLVLVSDRRRYHITPPSWTNARATALLESQHAYLFEPVAG